MKTIVEHIVESLHEQHEIVTATILEKSGSAPREAGAKMVIRKDATIEGTIGGGTLEAMAMRLAPTLFQTKTCSIEDLELSDNDARAAGMVCGGEVSVLLEHMDALDISQLNIYHKAKELKMDGVDFIMITKISHNGKSISGKNKWIFTESELFGEDDKEVQGLVEKLRKNFYHIKFHLCVEKNRYMIEPFYMMERLYIVGAGHVSQQIALLSKMLGFYTVVIDDREAFANIERFPSADEIHVVSSTYENLIQTVGIPKNSYIVIVTRGVDKIALEQALRTKARYIGMIGSKTKRNYVYEQLNQEGFSQEELSAVCCPIGVSINAQTPEEIAISILAELVKVRRS